MLPYACNFLSIGCDFTRWGIDGLEIEYPLGYANSGIVYFVTPAPIFDKKALHNIKMLLFLWQMENADSIKIESSNLLKTLNFQVNNSQQFKESK